MAYFPRIIEPHLTRYLQAFPVVAITGPRQSGKSTLLQHMFKDYTYITFDDPKNIEYFETDPDGFMQAYADHVIFDEVQHVPDLFHYLKIAVDKERKNYGKFILTGSSQLLLLEKISESLAGRIGLLTLLPLQYAEIPVGLSSESIYKGAYPELVARQYRDSELWYPAYFDTYINKDVRSLSNIGNLRDFRRFISLAAANVSQTLDLSSYAKELGISVPTVKRWISLLEASYIIFLLPPYYKNFGKRIIKSPKLYFYDTGLVSYLTGIKTWDQYDKGPMAGSLFENYLIAEILKKELHNKTDAELFYLRTSDKAEIDLIVDKKQTRDFIEIKKSATFTPRMLHTLEKFMTDKDQGYLLYNGDAIPYHQNIRVIHYTTYLRE